MTFRNRICIKFSKVFPLPANLARCNLYSSARKLIRPGECFENRFNYCNVGYNVASLENAEILYKFYRFSSCFYFSMIIFISIIIIILRLIDVSQGLIGEAERSV